MALLESPNRCVQLQLYLWQLQMRLVGATQCCTGQSCCGLSEQSKWGKRCFGTIFQALGACKGLQVCSSFWVSLAGTENPLTMRSSVAWRFLSIAFGRSVQWLRNELDIPCIIRWAHEAEYQGLRAAVDASLAGTVPPGVALTPNKAPAQDQRSPLPQVPFLGLGNMYCTMKS